MTQQTAQHAQREAHRWRSLLDSGCATADDRFRFQKWYAQSDTHAQAFDRAQSTWNTLGDLPRDAIDPALFKPSLWESTRAGLYRWLRTSSRQPALSLASAFALLVGVFVWWQATPQIQEPTQHTTQTGEIRAITFDDGTTVTLGADSRLSILYTDGVRQATLNLGDAFFDVYSEGRPFKVATNAATIQVTGTSFGISAYDSHTRIAVAEGSVSVVRAAEVVALEAGQTVVAHATRLSEVQSVESHQISAWRTGRLRYKGATLGEVVADANRYLEQSIRIVDPSVAALKVTASFEVEELKPGLQNLSHVLPIRFVERSSGWVIYPDSL
ncbi:MAG: FecR domain-containing protein [Pseudomonadota bacterium]